MNSLLQLSTVACEAERLCERTPSSDSVSASAPICPKEAPAFPTVRCIPSASNIKRPCEQILPPDRASIQDKIRSAYSKKATDYDSLLNLCVAVMEDRIYNEAPTKLDYYKQGISFVKRVFDKSSELNNFSSNLQELENAPEKNESSSSAEEQPRVPKRAKTAH